MEWNKIYKNISFIMFILFLIMIILLLNSCTIVDKITCEEWKDENCNISDYKYTCYNNGEEQFKFGINKKALCQNLNYDNIIEN